MVDVGVLRSLLSLVAPDGSACSVLSIGGSYAFVRIEEREPFASTLCELVLESIGYRAGSTEYQARCSGRALRRKHSMGGYATIAPGRDTEEVASLGSMRLCCHCGSRGRVSGAWRPFSCSRVNERRTDSRAAHG